MATDDGSVQAIAHSLLEAATRLWGPRRANAVRTHVQRFAEDLRVVRLAYVAIELEPAFLSLTHHPAEGDQQPGEGDDGRTV